MNIRMIGYGRLAKAIAHLWAIENKVIVSSPSQIHQCLDNGIETRQCNKRDLQFSDVVVLAVKPGLIETVLHEISPFLASDVLIVSLAAGVTLSQIKALIPEHTQVVRAMPNINAQVQASASLLLKNHDLSQKHVEILEKLFACLGSVDWVCTDDALDIGTILVGSGPAYVFYFMDAFVQSAIELGMSESLAKKLIVQTFLGSSQLAHDKNIGFQEFIAQVASPKGTTSAALEVMEKQEIPQSLDKAIQAAWQRVLALRT